MAVLSVNNISKTYIVDKILDKVSFRVEDYDKVGLIGLNGSGKTTIFDIISGKLEKDSGEIYIQKDLKIGYLEQHINIDSLKTVYEECLEVFQHLINMEEELRFLEAEISEESSKEESSQLQNLMDKYGALSEKFIELNGYGYNSEIRGVLLGLGFSEEEFERQVNLLSGGQKSRLGLAKLLLEKPDILLLDEPTNHLDIDAISWLERFLNDYTGASLIISHDRYFLDNVVNKIFHLENKNLKTYNTNYTDFMTQRKKDLAIQQKHFEEQQGEIKRQREIIERFKAYGGERYNRLAQSRQKALDKIDLKEEISKTSKTRIQFNPKIKSGMDVLSVEAVGKSFDDFKLLEDISFQIYRGERVGLIGANGIGKTTLFKMVLGELKYDEGNINIGHNVFPGYFDQEMESLNENKTIIDEIWDENPKLNHTEIRTLLGQFLFMGDDVFKEISLLSGGEKARINLLKLMLSKANFLLMDEPTNHLDIDSKEVLEDAVLDYNGTLFVISHDRYFLNRVCTKILDLTEDGIQEYLGNYNYYLEKKNELLNVEEESEKKTKTQIREEKKKERELLEIQRDHNNRIKKLEKDISKIEDSIKDIDLLLCDEEIYENPKKVFQLGEKRQKLQKELDKIYELWISLIE